MQTIVSKGSILLFTSAFSRIPCINSEQCSDSSLRCRETWFNNPLSSQRSIPCCNGNVLSEAPPSGWSYSGFQASCLISTIVFYLWNLPTWLIILWRVIPLLDTKRTVLAVLLGLQTKPLDYSHSFIADYTRRYYNLSITVLSRRIYNMKYRPVDVLSPWRLP
jgi:hypothetical protein